MNPNENIGDLIAWFENEMAEIAALANFPAAVPLVVPAPAVGAPPRAPRQVRRHYTNFAGLDHRDDGDEEPRTRRRRGRGRYRDLDADDMEHYYGRRRRRAGNAAGAGAGAGAPAPLAAAAPVLAAGGEGGGVAAIESALVPIVDLAQTPNEAGEANPQEDTCCIAARCQNPPVFTWLRCCGNSEACVHCVAEHVRLRGWTCPLCRGELRA